LTMLQVLTRGQRMRWEKEGALVRMGELDLNIHE
jgi:hypothetical protein